MPKRCNNYSWLGRGGTAEEVGKTALFLASPWAGYITGICLNVSGGMEFGTIPKYYAFDVSAERMKNEKPEPIDDYRLFWERGRFGTLPAESYGGSTGYPNTGKAMTCIFRSHVERG